MSEAVAVFILLLPSFAFLYGASVFCCYFVIVIALRPFEMATVDISYCPLVYGPKIIGVTTLGMS